MEVKIVIQEWSLAKFLPSLKWRPFSTNLRSMSIETFLLLTLVPH
jgi:hypothetical protein